HRPRFGGYRAGRGCLFEGKREFNVQRNRAFEIDRLFSGLKTGRLGADFVSVDGEVDELERTLCVRLCSLAIACHWLRDRDLRDWDQGSARIFNDGLNTAGS